jgi:hypothetical protein
MLEYAQADIDGLIVPCGKEINGNLAVPLFDADAAREASVDIASPYFSASPS